MSITTLPKLRTSGRISLQLGVPLHRVQHILATRPHIQPSALAGTIRLYGAAALAQVRHELNAQDARRSSRQGGQRG